MNSNTLFQQIQSLDQNISQFNFVIQSFQDNDQQIILEDILEKLNSILSQEKSLLYEFERQVSSKVDRIEFSQIVQQKANQSDVQKILFEILNCNNLSASQKIQNFLENSIPHDQESTENIGPSNPSYHQPHHHKNKPSQVSYDHQYSYQNSIERANDSPSHKINCDQCFGDNAKYPPANQRNPQFVLRQAFSSLSETMPNNNKENQAMYQGTQPINSSMTDVQKLSQKIDDIYQSLCSCIQNHCASKDELNLVQQQIDAKVNKEDLEIALLQKANKQSVANALQRKANKQDITVIEQRLSEQGLAEQDRIAMDIKFDEIRAQIERQKDSYIDLLQNEIMILKNETETSLKKSIGKELGKINSEISNIQESFQRYSAQIKENQDNTERRNEESYRSTQQRIEILQETVNKEMTNIRRISKENTKLDKLNDFERSVKAQLDEMDAFIKNAFKEISYLKDDNHRMSDMIKSRFEENEKIVKFNIDTLTNEVVKISKETYYEFDQIDRELQKLKYQQNQDSKGGLLQLNEVESFRLDVRELKIKLEKLNDEIAVKSNITDVCALVDLKANSEDVDKNLEQIYKEIQFNCATKTSLDQIMMDQKFINESLCSLNCIGKWVWHGGFTSGGTLGRQGFSANKNSFKMSAFERVQATDGTGQNGYVDFVKWQREIINTCPDNFELSKYDDDSSALIVHTNGIYEILFTFFVPPESHKPSVQLRINGKPVLSTIDTSQSVIYHQDSLRHISTTTYLHISAKSKVQLCLSNSNMFNHHATQQLSNMDYQFSPDTAKGFISLRKL